MPTFSANTTSGAMASSPRFRDTFTITFATPADDYVAGGYLLGLLARIGLNRTIQGVLAQGVVTATGAWDGVNWQYNATTDRVQGFKARNTIAAVAAIPAVANIGEELSAGGAAAVANVSSITVTVTVESF